MALTRFPTPAHQHRVANVLNLRGLAQRPHHIRQGVPGLLGAEPDRRRSNCLNHKGYGAAFLIRVPNGEGNPLSPFIHANDNKLSWSAMANHMRRFDHQTPDLRRQPNRFNHPMGHGVPEERRIKSPVYRTIISSIRREEIGRLGFRLTSPSRLDYP
jgi:hypothetical protein